MDGLLLIAAFVLAVFGVFMAVKPETIYYMMESSRSYDPGEPTKSYLIILRINGIMLAILGIACAVCLLIMPLGL